MVPLSANGKKTLSRGSTLKEYALIAWVFCDCADEKPNTALLPADRRLLTNVRLPREVICCSAANRLCNLELPGQCQSHLPVSSLTFSVLLISRCFRIHEELNRGFRYILSDFRLRFGHCHRDSLSSKIGTTPQLAQLRSSREIIFITRCSAVNRQCGLRLRRRNVPPMPGSLLPYGA